VGQKGVAKAGKSDAPEVQKVNGFQRKKKKPETKWLRKK